MKQMYNGYAFVKCSLIEGEIKIETIAQFGNNKCEMYGCIAFAEGYFKGREDRRDSQWIMKNASPTQDGWLWWSRKSDIKWMVVDIFGQIVKG